MSKAKAPSVAVLKKEDGADRVGYGSATVADALGDRIAVVESVAELAALNPTRNPTAEMTGTRKGLFVFDGRDLSSEVTSDPEQGFYVAPATDATGASGAFVRQPGSELPNPAWFGGQVDGTLSDDALAAVVSMFQGQRIALNDGEHNYSKFPSGIDNVRFEGSSRITWTDVELPTFNGVFTGGKEVAIVSGVLRYYATGPSGAGWYMLVDQGQNHDPILAGPVVASGNASVIVSINIGDFGLDANLWTPAGFVCGPDEALAKQGVTVGASVGATDIQIQGSISTRDAEFVSSNGSVFSGSSSRYSYEWINEGASNARLLVTQDNAASFYRVSSNGIDGFPMITTRQPNGSGGARPMASLAAVGTDGNGNRQFEISFWSLVDGSRVKNQSADMQFWMDDPSATPRQFVWSDIDESLSGSANVWFVGTFVRKPGSL